MSEKVAGKRISLMMLIPPVLFLAVAGLFYAGMLRENPDALPSVLKGKEAPAMQLAQLGDYPLLTDDALRQGEVTLVNFWASWCVPCRVEHPQLMKMSEEGIPIHSVNYKDTERKALDFISGLGNPFKLIGTDASGRTGIEWGIYGVPETFVIDGQGRIVERFAGPITTSVLEKTIRPAIARAAAAK